MVKSIIRPGIIVTLFVALIQVTSAEGDELYFIDAHSQVDNKVVPLQKVISIMKQGGVSHTILSTRGKLKGKALLSFASQYPEHITPALRTKGRPYETGQPNITRSLSGKLQAAGSPLWRRSFFITHRRAIRLQSMWSIQRMIEFARR